MGEINQYRTNILTKNDYRLQPITKRFVYDRKKINFLNTYCDFPTFIFIFSIIKHLRRIDTRLFVKMRSAILFCIFTVLFAVVSARIDPKNLKCLVCRTTFEELNDAIKKVDKWKTVDVGNFRMDASGNTMQDKVPAHRSAVYISEVIDGICKKMDDYVRVYYKATGKLAIMQLISPGGGMNPEFSKTKFVTDDDLNKSLEYYCERMFEENEDEITSLYKNRPDDDVMPDAEREICFDHAQYCEEWMLPTSEDTTWTMEMEAEYVKVHGPDPYGFGGGLPQMSQMPEVNEEYDEVPDTDDFDVPADKDEL